MKAIITSHSISSATGLSAFAAREFLLDRVAIYLACKKGPLSLEKYLEVMNEHILAIKGMDIRVDANNEGGYLGTRAEQVTLFLRGTGATRVINQLKNGTIAVEDAPQSLEEVCGLLTNWSGDICEPGEKRVSESIMSLQESDDANIYGFGASVDVGEEEASARRAASKSRDAQKKSAKAIADKASTTERSTAYSMIQGANPGCPTVPLVRTETPQVATDARGPCQLWRVSSRH